MPYDDQDDHEQAMRDGLKVLKRGTKLIYKDLVKPGAKAGIRGAKALIKKRKKKVIFDNLD